MRAIRLTTAILALFASFLVEGATIPITILHTSDLHAHLRPDDEGRGGFAELATVIAGQKRRATNVLVLDAGDLVQGTPVSTLFQGTPIYEVANLIGIDAGILGNHDFDYGWQHIQQFKDTAKFPLLCANVFNGNTTVGDAGSTVFVLQGVRIGVIGLTTETLPKITFPENVAGLRIENLVDSTRREIESLRGHADLFIALGHLQSDEGELLLKSLPELTAVVSGHVHSGRPPKRIGNGMVVGVPSYGRALGRLTLNWSEESRSVSSMDWEKIPVEHITPDPQVAHLVDQWESKVEKIVDVEIGVSNREFSGPEVKRLTEQALRDELGVDFAFQNPGGVRDKLPKGKILARHIWNIHPFDNRIVIGRFKGSDIPAAVRGGQELDPEKEYTLACSDYVAANQHEMGTQGLRFPDQKGGQVRDYMIDWIKKRKIIISKGIDSQFMDQQMAPGDDFFRYANGRWLETTPIPPDRDSWGVASQMSEQVDARLHALLTAPDVRNAPVGTDTRKAADFFATFMDEESIEAHGLTPLKAEFDRITAITNRAALAQALGEDLRADVDPLNNTEFHTTRLFGLWVSPDFNHAGRNAAYLLQGGLGMPDRDYYLEDNARMARLREQYQAYIASLFKQAGWEDAPARAARTVELETAIARVHATRQESEDTRRANNPWPRIEFAQRAPGLDWTAFFAGAGLDRVETMMVWHPGAVTGMAGLVGNQPLETWRDWMRFHALDQAAPYLPKALVNEHFSFHDHTLNGTPELPARWKRGVGVVNAALGDAVGRLYTDRYFPASSKEQLQVMTARIVAAFGKRIDTLTWMAPATKARAREKLATLRVGLGYPDRWVDYTGLEILPGDAVGNATRAELYHYRQQRQKIGTAVDTGEWWMVPQVVNAVNLPLQNALNFPAAILQPPFFDPAAPDAVNYGSIGSVIGHEISHSFDDQGAQFDAHGALMDWWTAEDRAHFEEAGRKLAAQYDAYAPFPDAHVNGTLTLSENIADLAGLAVAYDAWEAGLGGGSAPAVDGFARPQQFFLAYAQSWCSKRREASARRRLITDGHAPPEYRTATVRNLDRWYPAFDVRPDRKLYLPPEQRVRVW